MTMKTMLELLIRLQQLRECCERNDRKRQLTDGEKNTVRFFKSLVRGCLPTDVLLRYARMTEVKSELHDCPEVFAMAVLVTTWRELSPAGRRKLEKHSTHRRASISRYCAPLVHCPDREAVPCAAHLHRADRAASLCSRKPKNFTTS